MEDSEEHKIVRLVQPGHSIGPGVSLDPDELLKAALEELSEVIIVGKKKGTGELWISSSEGPLDAFAFLEVARRYLLLQHEKLNGWNQPD